LASLLAAQYAMIGARMLPGRAIVPFLLAGACLATLAATQGAPQGAPVDAVSIGGLERRLRFIASDALEGRESLSPGFHAAAEYLVSELTLLGLTPRGDNGSFLQKVTMRRASIDEDATKVEVDGRRFAYGDDLLASGSGTAEGRVIYVGHGWRIASRSIDPFAGLDVKDAILLVLSGMPRGVAERDLEGLVRDRDYYTPTDNARALGARGVIVVPTFDDLAAWARTRERQAGRGALVVDRLVQPTDLPVVTASPRLMTALMRGEKESGGRLHDRAGEGDAGSSFALAEAKRVRLVVESKVTREDTFNVVASVDGRDPARRDEFVALGAHLDHIGLRAARPGTGRATADRSAPPDRSASARRPGADEDVINNGADDDGSGVVALMEIAGALVRAPRPARSLMFVWHTGEEAGGWGSKYFTAFPPVPLKNIVAQLNVDMVGRSRRPADEGNSRLTGPDEVYLVGARRLSRQLGDTIERVNREYLNLTFNPAHDDPADPERIYERSDHYEYAKHGIPVAFFFSGLHEDYHRVSDEVDRIDFVKLQKVARTVLAAAWAIAEAPERPALDAPARDTRE
jgi:hypothetical protein